MTFYDLRSIGTTPSEGDGGQGNATEDGEEAGRCDLPSNRAELMVRLWCKTAGRDFHSAALVA